MKRALIVLGMTLCFFGQVQAQNDDFGDDFKKDFESFRRAINKDFENFRKEINKDYAEFLKNPWEEFTEKKPLVIPKEEAVPPVIYPEEDRDKPFPAPEPLPYDVVIPVPKPTPQPKPVEPIKENRNPVPKVDFSWLGTSMSVRFNTSTAGALNGAGEQDVAEWWLAFSSVVDTDNLVYDCLKLRRDYSLCDWAYLEMLHALSEEVYGKESNRATLLMAYLFCQSGYKMRLASDGADKLYMLFASRHHIYDLPRFVVDGETYYPFGECPSSLYISNGAFPGEQSLSLWLSSTPKVALSATSLKTRQSERYPDVKITLSSNKNLMDFYSSYPTSMVGDNVVSRWAMYANTPMSEDVKRQIYPDLKAAINGCDQLTAVNKLLNFVQTGFEYEYDDKVWGDDRAFFAEESLYYPYCDCEDRSILFTRLVRDLLGLRCILIYYPGHLASAVEFSQSNTVAGDYISLKGHKFVIADATFIGAPVGKTMYGMDNQTAKVILLE